MLSRTLNHFEENVARYATLALVILIPLGGGLGELAAKLGGADTKAGQLATGAAAAVGVAVAGATFLSNLGKYQIERDKPTFTQLEEVIKALGGDPVETGAKPDSIKENGGS